MKHIKLISISILAALMFLGGCSGTTSYVENDYTLPVLKVKPRIMYPKEAQQNNYKGTSRVCLFINEKGTVDEVKLLESSGYSILDDAALDYCKQLIFEPAVSEGQAVKSRMFQNISFDFLDYDFTIANYISNLKQLYKEIKNTSEEEKGGIEDQILAEHDQFVKEMDDALNFNDVLKEVLLEDICANWQDCWDRWPLSFLLYHDFIQRYPDYDSLSLVKQHLQNALKSDLYFIMSNKTMDDEVEKNKMDLITRIKEFMKTNYPDISVQGLYAKGDINS